MLPPTHPPDIDSAEEEPADDSLLEKLAEAAQVPAARAVQATKRRFRLLGVRAAAPLWRLNPTSVRMHVNLPRRRRHGADSGGDEDDGGDDDDGASEFAIVWRSRDNRKGRQSIAFRGGGPAVPSRGSDLEAAVAGREFEGEDVRTGRKGARLTSSAGGVAVGIWRMVTRFPYWDMAYWVGFWFTLGSMIWVANGFMAWLPVAYPGSEAPGQVEYGVGITSFVGVMAFQVGATLAYLEAVNEGCWHGSMMRRLIDGHDGVDDKAMVDQKIRAVVDRLDPRRRHSDGGEGGKITDVDADVDADVDGDLGWDDADIVSLRSRHGSVFWKRRGAIDMGAETEEGAVHELLPFRWWPTWKNLREHHVYEVGFLACATQFIGATIFIITGVVALPGILNDLKPWQENMAYWVPQMVASVGFVLGSAFFVLETQEKWWRPQPKVLGWWVGVWALAGSVGFEYVFWTCRFMIVSADERSRLCACLGPAIYHNTAVSYQNTLASLWGSICFLISSVLQLYEAVNKNPIEEWLDEPGEMKTWQIHPL